MHPIAVSRITALRAELARLEGNPSRREAASVPLCEGIDLPGGGLARAAIHEVLAEAPGCGAGFCALLLGRAGGSVIWIHPRRDVLLPWPPGLARCGLPPERLVLVQAESPADALWAMEEALRCQAVGGVLLGLGTARPDLTATRRLHLAAEAGGGLGLLLGAGLPADMAGRPSAAATRWRVSPRRDGVDLPRWSLELLRVRGGRPGGPWPVELRDGDLRLEAG